METRKKIIPLLNIHSIKEPVVNQVKTIWKEIAKLKNEDVLANLQEQLKKLWKKCKAEGYGNKKVEHQLEEIEALLKGLSAPLDQENSDKIYLYLHRVVSAICQRP